jgi:hypothetical protein
MRYPFRLWRTLLLLLVFVVLFTTWFVRRQQRLEQEAVDLLNKPFVEYKEVVRLLGPPTSVFVWGDGVSVRTWDVTVGNRSVRIDVSIDGEGKQRDYHRFIDEEDEEISPWHRLRSWIENLDWPW